LVDAVELLGDLVGAGGDDREAVRARDRVELVALRRGGVAAGLFDLDGDEESAVAADEVGDPGDETPVVLTNQAPRFWRRRRMASTIARSLIARPSNRRGREHGGNNPVPASGARCTRLPAKAAARAGFAAYLRGARLRW
jgi:hypothetical protein